MPCGVFFIQCVLETECISFHLTDFFVNVWFLGQSLPPVCQWKSEKATAGKMFTCSLKHYFRARPVINNCTFSVNTPAQSRWHHGIKLNDTVHIGHWRLWNEKVKILQLKPHPVTHSDNQQVFSIRYQTGKHLLSHLLGCDQIVLECKTIALLAIRCLLVHAD